MNASTVSLDLPAGKGHYYDGEAIALRAGRAEVHHFGFFRDYVDVSQSETKLPVSLILIIVFSYHHRSLDHA
jgi:hypothetical protein